MKHTETTKKLMSKNSAKYWLGKKIPRETVKRIADKLRGRKMKPRSEEAKQHMKDAWVKMKERGIRPAMLGRKHSEETKKKMSIARTGKYLGKYRGDKSPSWKGGVTSINQIIRTSTEYKLWRQSVFIRDNYTCRFCGKKGGEICVDHIKPFSLFPELRFAIDNGRTLCKPCHLKTDTYAGNLRKKYD